MKILVTGASGFIGGYVVKELLKRNYQVKIYVRETSDLSRIENLPYEKIIGIIEDDVKLSNALKDCIGIIHLAGPSSWNEIILPRVVDQILHTTEKFVSVLSQNPTVKAVYVSSSAAINATNLPVEQNENSAFNLSKSHFGYAWAKHQSELILKNYASKGLFITIINPSEVYGPNDIKFITASNLKKILDDPILLLPKSGTGIVHVQDVAKGIVNAFEMGKSGERYILSSENLTYKQLATFVLEAAGIRKLSFEIPNSFLKKVVKIFPKLSGISPELLEYATKYWYMSNEKAKKELGMKFKSAKDTILETVQWMKNFKS